jgi:hypothetical protein
VHILAKSTGSWEIPIWPSIHGGWGIELMKPDDFLSLARGCHRMRNREHSVKIMVGFTQMTLTFEMIKETIQPPDL